MKHVHHLVLFLLLAAVVAAISCYTTSFVMRASKKSNAIEAHYWIHDQLKLTREQDQKLESTEKRFSEQKKHYNELIHIANMELAQAILQDKNNSPRVATAIKKIQQAQGALQKATLQHVFEMKEALTSEQYQKLLDSTANALYQIDHKE